MKIAQGQVILSMLEYVNAFLWGPYMLTLMVGTGVYLMCGLAFVPLRKIGFAMNVLCASQNEKSKQSGDISPYQALMTAISGSVGTGNIAGVATAIFLGGPGALFYMWLTALIGMASSYTEAACAVKYRIVDDKGYHVGGPMFYLSRGVGQKYPTLGSGLAILYAMVAMFSILSIGNLVQINSIAAICQDSLGIQPIITGMGVAFLVGCVLLGGIKRIADVAGWLVPFMILFYLGAGIAVLIVHYDAIGHAFGLIFQKAFELEAVGGGALGAGMASSVRYGVSRGVFSNEAGLGTCSIAHAAAKTKDPVRQGLVAMLGTFIDTIVVCTITGLVILVTGGYHLGDTGSVLTARSFDLAIPGGMNLVTVALTVFAFTTMLGYSYYGEKSAQYLLGDRAILPYRFLWIVLIPFGAVFKLELVWALAESLMALMIIPNLIGLIILGPTVFDMTRRYYRFS